MLTDCALIVCGTLTLRLWAIPFNIHTPLWTRSIIFKPLRKKDQSADTNTPQKKRKDQRMPMHTTPQKQLFQTPSEILVHRGGGILNGMALYGL
jgi:hypothetical protein